jgi:hypothetical protein
MDRSQAHDCRNRDLWSTTFAYPMTAGSSRDGHTQ